MIDFEDEAEEFNNLFKPMHIILGVPGRKVGNLYLGDITSAESKSGRESGNIDAVMTVAAGAGVRSSQKGVQLFSHFVIQAHDDPSYHIYNDLNLATHWIHQNLKTGNVLVHCMAGVSRSATVVIAYLMKYRKKSFENAFKFVRKRRPMINPNSGFIEQLRDYENNECD